MASQIAATILRLLSTPGIGVVTTNSLLASLGDCMDPARLKPLLSAKQYEAFQATEEKVGEDLEKLEEQGVTLITALDDRYPTLLRVRLSKNAPPLLMTLGNSELLKKVAVGFCGSRKASDKGLATATDCADQLARADINIVSGYAAGVDMATHIAALQGGGTTTLVLCEGILHFQKKRTLQDQWDWDRILVVSEFLPGIPWSVRNAMQRNKTICALTSAMILIESSSKGGSIEAGRACLKMGIPLFAPVYEAMPETAVGNRELLQQGAHELFKSLTKNRANMTSVLSLVSEKQQEFPTTFRKGYVFEEQGQQLGLFDKRGEYKTG